MTAITAVSLENSTKDSRRLKGIQNLLQWKSLPMYLHTYLSLFSSVQWRAKKLSKWIIQSFSEINRSYKKVFKSFAQFRLELINPRESRRLRVLLQSL